MLVASSLETIAAFLAQHEDTLRIRKLLFCACENRWETNAAILRNLSLENLLHTLHQKHTSLEGCTAALFGIVEQLNRKSQYRPLAELVISRMGVLYPPLEEPEETTQITRFVPKSERTQFIPVSPPPPPARSHAFPYDSLAQRIDEAEEAVRMRKMLWCICRQAWESNAQILLSLDLVELLQEVQFTFPTAADLQRALNGVVQSVNRKAQYSAIATTLLQYLESLYHAQTIFETPLPLEDSGLPVEAAATRFETIDSPQPPESLATQILADPIAYPPTAILSGPVVPPPIVTEYNLVSSTDFSPQDLGAIASTPSGDTATPYDAFAVRLAVMKYANPLRAKILVFSTVHHTFETRGQDWSNLRTHSFDSLLGSLYESYTEFDQLVTNLCQTAQNLESPDESLQAAEAIAKALKPYYS